MMQYDVYPSCRQSDRAAFVVSWELQQSDRTALENASDAVFDLVLTDGATAVDLSDHVSAPTSSSVQVEIPVSEWAAWSPTDGEPVTLTGWLIYTPSDGIATQLVEFEGIELVWTPEAS